MKLRTLAALLGTLSLAAAENLVSNGAFEDGREHPSGWTAPDGLTVFWDHRGVPGKCLRFDTDVYRREWEAQRERGGDAPMKTPTQGKRYDTVAGSVGVTSWSLPIDVSPGEWYLMEVDARGPGGSEPFVYLKGYRQIDAADVGRHGALRFMRPAAGGPAYSVVVGGTEQRPAAAGDFLQVYRARLVCRIASGAGGQWRRYRRAIQIPATGNARAERVLLMLFAYWPPGDYAFDNVVLRPISAAEATAVKRDPNGQAGVPVP